MPYDDLRKNLEKDHDLLISLMQLMENNMKNFDAHVKVFDAHILDDRSSFTDLRKDNMELQKAVWKAAGIVTCVQLVPALYIVFKFFNH